MGVYGGFILSYRDIGEKNQLEKVSEYKVELVCEDQYIKAALAALKTSHPYEEPAYQIWKLEKID